jgi:hypothetical protein
MDGEEGEPVGGRRVDPLQSALDPRPGLVEVRHRSRAQLLTDALGDLAQTRSALNLRRCQGPRGQRSAEAVGEHLPSWARRGHAGRRRGGPQGPAPPARTGQETTPRRGKGQRRRSARCSTTSRRIGGRSNIWRVSVCTTSAAMRLAPQPPQVDGAWTTTSSATATGARCVPGAPGCFPGLRPERTRRDLG